ncbi:MAG: hypothetical protein V2B14_05860 [bacterium]
MPKNSKITISGIFDSSKNLSEMINFLEGQGISEDDISILMSEETQKNKFSVDTKTKASEEAIKGLATGGLLGAVIGGLTLIGAVIIPGLGLVVAGPIIGVMTGMTTGGIIGSIIGALVGLGIPEHEAKFYENAVKEKGNILLVAHINTDLKNEIKKQFDRYGAFHIATQQ